MRGSRPAVLLVAGALLLLVVFAASGESAVPAGIFDPDLERGLPSVPMMGSGVQEIDPSQNMTIDVVLVGKVMLGVVAAVLVLAVLSSVRHARRMRGRIGVGHVTEPVEGTVDTVLRLRLKEAVVEARAALSRSGGEPGDAVVRAWVTLENATEHRRAPHQTATEFTTALLAEETADEEAVHELRTLYQRARFGRGGGAADAAAAADALDRILATVR